MLTVDKNNYFLSSSKLLAAYKQELRDIIYPDDGMPYSLFNEDIFTLNGIIQRLMFTNYTLITDYIKLMNLQEKYKIAYILDCTIYDTSIFDKIATSKYIQILYIPTLINDEYLNNEIARIKNIERAKDHGPSGPLGNIINISQGPSGPQMRDNQRLSVFKIREISLNIINSYEYDKRFLYNEHIKTLKIKGISISIENILFIISNTKINELYIYNINFNDLNRLFTALNTSSLHTLKIHKISNVIYRNTGHDINDMVNTINNSHIKLKTLILPPYKLPDPVIESLLKNIKLYNTMETLVLAKHSYFNETCSTLLGQLIVDSSLLFLDMTSCTVDDSMWPIITHDSYIDSYKTLNPLKLRLPNIANWYNVRHMLTNNIRINNLLLKYNYLGREDSHILAEGLLKNEVIDSITIEYLEYKNDDPTDYYIIFDSIIKRKINLQSLYVNTFHYYHLVNNQLKYMLHNNWLKVLHITDTENEYDMLEYIGPDIKALQYNDIMEIIGYIADNTSLSEFYYNPLEKVYTVDEMITVSDDMLNRNSTLLKCVLGKYNIAIAQRNTMNNIRKNISLQNVIYNSIDYNNIINVNNDKQFIAHYIHRQYQ